MCHLQPGLCVLSEFLSVDRHVILGQPVAEEDGPGQGLVTVDVGEVLQSHHVHILVCPLPLVIFNKSEQIQKYPQ